MLITRWCSPRHHWEESDSAIFILSSFHTYTHWSDSLDTLLLQAEESQLNLPSHEKKPQTHEFPNHLGWPFAALTPVSKCTATLLYRGTQTLTQALRCVSQGLSREKGSSPSECWWYSDDGDGLCCKGISPDHVLLGVHQDIQIPFCKLAFQPVSPPACSVLWSYLFPGAGYSATRTLSISLLNCVRFQSANFSDLLKFL